MELQTFTDFQKSEYSRLKAQAKQGWLLFAEAIVKIRDGNLYGIEYRTFDDFCSVELGISGNYGHKLIASAETVENIKKLYHGTVLPNSERQARPLTKLEPELQIEAWAEVIEETPLEKITAKVIDQKVEEKKELNETLKKVKEENQVTVFVPHPLSEKEILAKAKEIQDKIKEEKIAQRKEEIETQRQQIENSELPKIEGKFDVISVDPPWQYEANTNVNTYDPNGRRVANPYPEMSLDEIKAIELPATNDSVVFLWTTQKFLPSAFEILKGWGYEYKATMVWDKQIIGMGHWFRMQCEFCLVGIKGKPFWDNKKYSEIISEKRREHSRKPDSFFQLVNKICAGRKLEYFAREKRNGWEVFGNDVNKF